MKKQFFLSILFAVLALISMAQTPTLLPLDIDTNTITTHSFYIPAQAFGGGGTWYVEPQVKKVNTNIWIPGDTGMYTGTGMSFSVMKDSLLANTDYLPRLVVYNSALVQVATVTYPTVRTKPDPEPVTIGSAFAVPMLPNSGLGFTGGSSVGQQAFALGYPMTGGAPLTDTVFFGFTSSFSGTVTFLVDGPNFFHPSTRVVIQGLSDGSVASAIIPAFSSPAYTATTMTMGTPVVTKDSVFTNINITSLGNGGNPTLQVTITDTLGPVVYQSLQVITATGPIGIPKGSLLSNHYYRITATAITPVNMTTVSTKVFKTLNVDPSTVTVSQQLPQDYVTYTAKSFINPKGSGDSSRVVYAELLENNIVVNSTMLALNDTGTITFTQTGQTSGTSKSVKVRVTNGANLVTTSSSVNVSMLAVGTPIMNPTTSVKTVDSIYVGFNVTNLGIPLNPTFHVVIKNQLGVTILDSTRLVTSTGIIGIGKGGLVSNNTFTITATLANTMMLGDTEVVVITTKNVNPPSVTATYTRTYTDYTITSVPNKNGTWDSSVIKQLNYYEDGVLVGIDSTGSNVFNRTGRTQGQLYHIKVEVVNKANLSSFITFNITMQQLQPNQVPHIVDVLADNAATARVVNISYGASAGNTSTIRLVWKILQIGFVDTATPGAGLMGSGIIPVYTLTNCVGGYTLQVTVIDESPAGTVVGNTIQQNMPLPDDLIVGAVTLDSATTTATTLGVHIFASGEGNIPLMKLWLYKNNVLVGSVFSTTVSSGPFDYPYVWDNLDPNTEYKVVVELSAPGKQPVTTIAFFRTQAITAVEEVKEEVVEDVLLSAATINPIQTVRMWNLLGQEIGYGEFLQTAQRVRESNLVVIISLFNQEKKRWSKPQKLPLMNF